MEFIVYKTTNIINGMIYIGCHKINNNEFTYLGSGTNIKKAIKEFGKNNFSKEILYRFDNKNDMLIKERDIVNEEFIAQSDNYNIVLGGGNYCTLHCITVKDKFDNTMMVHKSDPRYISGELIPARKGDIREKGKINVKDKNGKYLRIDNANYKYLNGEFTHSCVGLVTVKDSQNNTLQVSVNDNRYLNKELVGINKGKVTVRDNTGKCFNVDKNDPRYLSGELVSNIKGRVKVRDKDNNIFTVYTSDERYLSGELVYYLKGTLMVDSPEGRIRISKNDPRYLSGELISIFKNKRHSTETKLKISKSMGSLFPDNNGEDKKKLKKKK